MKSFSIAGAVALLAAFTLAAPTAGDNMVAVMFHIAAGANYTVNFNTLGKTHKISTIDAPCMSRISRFSSLGHPVPILLIHTKLHQAKRTNPHHRLSEQISDQVG